MKKYRYVYYVIGLFLFFEISSRLILRNESFLQDECSASWRIKWVRRHQEDGIEIFYVFDVYHPTRGWALKAGLDDMLYFNREVLNSNSRGLRGNREYAYDKPRGTLRILILGDSYTFGEEVSDEETFSFYLQRMIPSSEVLNFGVHGYGHDQMLVYLQEEGVKYKPDIVILGFMKVDMVRNMLYFRDYAKPRFRLMNGRLRKEHSPVLPPEAMLKNEWWKPKIIDVITLCVCKLSHRMNDISEEEKATNAILEEIVRTVRDMNAVPVFVYLSDIFLEDVPEETLKYEKAFSVYWQRRNVPCVFVRPHIQAARKEGLTFRETGHFGPQAHRVIARVIKDFLVNLDGAGK